MLLSIVIPAWNEEHRLLPVLESIRSYCVSHLTVNDYEVIVVDDGSRDGTAALVHELAAAWDELQLIRLPQNRGKGAALRTGCVNAGGEFLLFYDADGATSIDQEALLRSELTEQSNLHVAMGVRYRAGSDATMGVVRRGLGCLFAACASLVVGRRCADTQCGFKMFRRESVLPIVRQCRENGYTFDVELLSAIHRRGLAMCECSIPWTAMPGSKVSLFRDGATMLWRLAAIRLRHLSGAFSHVGDVPPSMVSLQAVPGKRICTSATAEQTAHE